MSDKKNLSGHHYERIRAALAMGPTPGEWYWTDAYPAGERVFAEGSRRYRASRVGQDSD